MGFKITLFAIFFTTIACTPQSLMKVESLTKKSEKEFEKDIVQATVATSLTRHTPTTASGSEQRPTITVSPVVSGEMVYLFIGDNCQTQVGAAVADATTVNIRTSSYLTVGTHRIRSKSSNDTSTSECSTAYVDYTFTGLPPTAPTIFTRVDPTLDTGIDSTPTFIIGDVQVGDTVALYHTSCINANKLSEVVADTISVTMTTSVLAPPSTPPTPRTYNFYAKVSNSIGNTGCVNLGAFYKFLGAPPITGNSMTLVSPTSSINSDSTPTIRISGVYTGETAGIYVDSSCTTLVASGVVPAGSSSIELTTSVLVAGVYSFYTKSTNIYSATASSCSSSLLSYDVRSPPQNPTAISLKSPTTPNTEARPTLTVTGVQVGDTITLYSNSTCTTAVGSAVATGDPFDLITNSLVPGSYTIYTKSSNLTGEGTCSAFFATYRVLPAPHRATSISLITPISSPSHDGTPTIRLHNVYVDEIVRVYDGAGCGVEIGEVTTTGAGTVDVTVSELPVGVHGIYTKSSNYIDTVHTACSPSALLSYEHVADPTPATGFALSSLQLSDYDSTPTFILSGIVAGETISIFEGAGCGGTALTSGVATSTSLYLTLPAATVAAHTYSTSSENSGENVVCSGVTSPYEYLGANQIDLSWDPNRERAVNSVGGGYRVYYGVSTPLDTSTASSLDVPYVSGNQAPTTTVLPGVVKGTYYFIIEAYSPVGGETISPQSDEVSVVVN